MISGYVEKYATIAGRAMTPDLYKIYIEALSDLELRRIEKGLKSFLKNGDRWPWPGELRSWIEDEI